MKKRKSNKIKYSLAAKVYWTFFDDSLGSYYGSIILLLPDLGKVYAKVIKPANNNNNQRILMSFACDATFGIHSMVCVRVQKVFS